MRLNGVNAGEHVGVRTRGGIYDAVVADPAIDKWGRVSVYLNGSSKPGWVQADSLITPNEVN